MSKLRRIKIDIHSSNPVEGFFHRWYEHKGESNETTLYAIVEGSDGKVYQKYRHEIQFTDMEKKKTDLRPIEIVPTEDQISDHDSFGGNPSMPKTGTGYFHKHSGKEALVELEDGRIYRVKPEWLRFRD